MSNGSFCLVFALKIHFAHFSAQGVHACVSECVRAQHSLHEPCEPTTLSEKEKTHTSQLDGNELLCHELIESVALLLTLEKYCAHKSTLFVYLWTVKMPLEFFLSLSLLRLWLRLLLLIIVCRCCALCFSITHMHALTLSHTHTHVRAN